jgi:hypothetical protein
MVEMNDRALGSALKVGRSMLLNHGSLIPLTSQYFRPVLSWPFQSCYPFSYFPMPAIWNTLAFENVYLASPAPDSAM